MQTILVIDDDESLRDTIGVLLEREGFRPVLIGDGRTGLQQTLTLKPDLLLVDLRLPGISGMEVCKHVRAAGQTTPMIVLSAIGVEECAYHFFARRVRPIGLRGELRHGSPLF